MHSIQDNRLEVLELKGTTVRLLNRLHYLAGKQANATAGSPDLFAELRAEVIVQGTRSSNEVEGLRVDEDRYPALMQNKLEPNGRIEKLVLGYRDTLSFIHTEWRSLPVTPATILDLHRRLQAHLPDPVEGFRQEDVVIERDEQGERTIVFRPPPHRLVAEQVEGLCQAYRRLHESPETDEFLLMAGFIFDFTCIHPFEGGNGRVSRLLTTLLAYKAGFEVVRYISHERLVAETRLYYYAALTTSSHNWLRSQHRWSPWITYFASKFVQAYEQLELRITQAGGDRGYQSRRIQETIDQLPARFSIRDIFDRLPTATRPTVNRVLAELKASGQLETVGAGPKAYYRKTSALDG